MGLGLVTKKDLKNYLGLTREIQELRQELEELYVGPEGSVLGQVTTKKGGKKRRDLSDTVTHMITIEELLSIKYNQLKAERLRIEEALEMLPAGERVIIRMRYLQGYPWVRIQLQLELSEASVTRAHSRALQRLLETPKKNFQSDGF